MYRHVQANRVYAERPEIVVTLIEFGDHLTRAALVDADDVSGGVNASQAFVKCADRRPPVIAAPAHVEHGVIGNRRKHVLNGP